MALSQRAQEVEWVLDQLQNSQQQIASLQQQLQQAGTVSAEDQAVFDRLDKTFQANQSQPTATAQPQAGVTTINTNP